MKLTPPKNMTFWVAVLLGVLGIVGKIAPTIPVVGLYPFWFVFIGFLILVAGLLFKGF